MIVLASASPRRAEILRAAGIDFTVRAAEVNEDIRPEEAAGAYVQRLARDKARAAQAGGETILGADTSVVAGKEILGKPSSEADAARMLRKLAGRWHEVMTGICLCREDRELVDMAVTRVKFAAMSESEIAAYAASGEPVDKAGGYAIQGMASRYVERIEGCYFNVVGLPVSLVWRRLAEFRG